MFITITLQHMRKAALNCLPKMHRYYLKIYLVANYIHSVVFSYCMFQKNESIMSYTHMVAGAGGGNGVMGIGGGLQCLVE